MGWHSACCRCCNTCLLVSVCLAYTVCTTYIYAGKNMWTSLDDLPACCGLMVKHLCDCFDSALITHACWVKEHIVDIFLCVRIVWWIQSKVKSPKYDLLVSYNMYWYGTTYFIAVCSSVSHKCPLGFRPGNASDQNKSWGRKQITGAQRECKHGQLFHFMILSSCSLFGIY